jgi:hypothetical protein
METMMMETADRLFDSSNQATLALIALVSDLFAGTELLQLENSETMAIRLTEMDVRLRVKLRQGTLALAFPVSATTVEME